MSSLERRCMDLIHAAHAAEVKAETMRGDPNEIARAEGYADGLAVAVLLIVGDQ